MAKASFTQEDVLPISLIRQHCKIDDIGRVSDILLSLYRSSAFEAAELYTGRIWFGTRRIIQPITSPKFRTVSQAGVARFKVELDYMPIGGYVEIEGFNDQAAFWFMDMPFNTAPRYTSHSITLPPNHQAFYVRSDQVFMNMSSDCDCDASYSNKDMTATYNAGITRSEEIPAGMKIGALKYIAWTVEHAGDDFVPVVAQGRTVGISGGNVVGSNDALVGSGAIDDFRRYRRNIAR